MGDIRVPLDAALAAFGLPVIVRRPSPHNTPISTTGFWLSEIDAEQPYGQDLARGEPIKLLVIPRLASGPQADRGTTIQAAAFDGGPIKTWRVEGYAHNVEPDCLRLIVRTTEPQR